MSTADSKQISGPHRYSGLVAANVVLLLWAVGLFVSLQFPRSASYLGCSRDNLINLRVYTLVTYALYPFSLDHLVGLAVSLLLSVYFIGNLLTPQRIWLLITGSTVLGAVLFCGMVKPPALLVGGGMVTWGLVGAVLALGLTNWRHLGILRRVYLVLVTLFTISLIFSFSALTYAQLLVATGAFTTVLFWHRNDNSTRKHLPLLS